MPDRREHKNQRKSHTCAGAGRRRVNQDDVLLPQFGGATLVRTFRERSKELAYCGGAECP